MTRIAATLLFLALAGCSTTSSTVGLGTVAYVLLIGPLIQTMLPWFDARPRIPAIGVE